MSDLSTMTNGIQPEFMPELKMAWTSLLPRLLLALFCAFCVIFARMHDSTIIEVWGIPCAYTDFFVLVAAGLGGLGTGLITFVTLSLAEALRYCGEFEGMYAISTYLILVLLSSYSRARNVYGRTLPLILSTLLIALVLALCWYVTFTLLVPLRLTSNYFHHVSIGALFLGALPETALAQVLIAFFLRAMGRYRDKKKEAGDGDWSLLEGGSVLGTRITCLALLEAVVLCVVGVLGHAVFMAETMDSPLSFAFLAAHGEECLRMGLTLICAATPVCYLFNLYVLWRIVCPVKTMGTLMERYFEHGEDKRRSQLPDLALGSDDEIAHLYASLKKMVTDMSLHIERELESERRSIHLTQGFMLALAKAVDAKDRYTSGHSTRVALYAREIARRLGKTESEQEKIYVLGLLHDIGKIGIPESIINKNGRLTDEEYAKIKEHPVMGFEILKNVTELPKLATGARWHHERYDGKGYPDGLSGADIPEEARIIAVADAYDAMTSRRAYSGIRPQDAVRSEIERCRGSQFDPDVADIMLKMIDDDPEYTMHEGEDCPVRTNDKV